MVTAAALALGCVDTSALILLSAGDHTLLPNQPGQTLTLHVNNTGLTPITVDGFTLFLMIGDGGPVLGGNPVPAVTGVDLHTGTAFNGNFTPEIDQGSQDGIVQWYITPQTVNTTIAPGLSTLATLTIDTTGFGPTAEPWTLALSGNMPSFGFISSSYVLGSVEVSDVTLAGGSLSLAAVPEPSEVALVAGLGLIGFGVWRRIRPV